MMRKTRTIAFNAVWVLALALLLLAADEQDAAQGRQVGLGAASAAMGSRRDRRSSLVTGAATSAAPGFPFFGVSVL